MVNREQEQARLLAESMGPDGRAGRDLAWIVVLCVLLSAGAIATNGVDRVLDRVNQLDSANLNGLVALLLILPVGATVFAVRRYHDAATVRTALEDLSYHDSLTGLMNRRFLGDGFDDLMQRSRRNGTRLVVLFIDLDGFKHVNDTYGHEVGDQLMIVVADRLRQATGKNDAVIRYGGDEFVVIYPDFSGPADGQQAARRLIKVIETPIERSEEVLRISASIGIAVSEERPVRADEILRDADAAMYRAKAAGAGSYALFDRSMRDVMTPSTAERRLREALDRGEFRLFYQPVVSLWTRRMVGVEALLRWDDPQRGLVGPAEFLQPLEDTGLIVPVGNWIIREAFRQCRAWQDEFPDRPALSVKVNITGRQLAQIDFLDTLSHALQSSGAEPESLCLELTEIAIMADDQLTRSALREVKALGLSLALDDFGTGYSSISYLRNFSLDLLKIDNSFVAGLAQSREDETIVEHLIAMAKALGIVTVAEGVETEDQVERLRALHCDLAQGYYFSHPQPPHVINQLLASDGNAAEWTPIAAPPDGLDPDHDTARVVKLARFARDG